MSRLLRLCAVGAVLLLAGCSGKSDDTATEQKEYERSVERRLAEYDARFDTLKARLAVADEQLKAEAREDLARLESERRKAQVRLDSLRVVGSGYWTDLKLTLAAGLDSLDQELDRARARLRSG